MVGILFFPLNILNYIVLFIVNLIVGLANLLLFLLQLLVFLIINLVVFIINVIIEVFNNFSITIPVIDVDIDLPDLPILSYITFPAFGIIPYLNISQTTFLPDKILLLWIFELFGFSLF